MKIIEKKIKNELVYKLRREIRLTSFVLDYMESYVDLTDKENLECYNKWEARFVELNTIVYVLENNVCELSDKTIESINNKIKERGTDI